MWLTATQGKRFVIRKLFVVVVDDVVVVVVVVQVAALSHGDLCAYHTVNSYEDIDGSIVTDVIKYPNCR